MISNEVSRLEYENQILKQALEELGKKIESNNQPKPKSCQYCKFFMQHYIKESTGYPSEYSPIYDGHCTRGIPVSKGGKKRPKPDDSCPYFEIGTTEMKWI